PRRRRQRRRGPHHPLPPPAAEHVRDAARAGDGLDPAGDHRRGRALVPRARRAAADAVVGLDALGRAAVHLDRRVARHLAGPRELPRDAVVRLPRRRPARHLRPEDAAMTENGPLLSVRDVTVRFDTEDGPVHAVDRVSFDVKRGEVLAIVGESGCGKSVTTMSLLGLLPDTASVEGEARFNGGTDLIAAPEGELRRIRGREISFVFQDPMTSLNPVFTVGRQVGEVLRRHLGMSKEQARERTIKLLELVGIPSPERRVDEYPHQLSGGMRQRVMIAMAIACEPKVLIADEPTTALDVTIQAAVLDVLRELRERLGMAIVLITH